MCVNVLATVRDTRFKRRPIPSPPHPPPIDGHRMKPESKSVTDFQLLHDLHNERSGVYPRTSSGLVQDQAESDRQSLSVQTLYELP